ncbi:HAMP domain-containing protein [Rhizobium sp. ARZ01]|uniref:methyl-accepting chemotaxis protein n=1 Tax=Rhizobium sp. ARZ01 TaxID=2769313 RepID=UPI00178171C4|nr:HAMP domain-containing methyl-accepting chemotaxis protein [Rhizobium sp. ARZ01]MBD9373045.1 HAMP domain-containing protein [Rhizobium sp. ARZ01]
MSRLFAQLKIAHRIFLLAVVAFVGIAMISGIFLFQREVDGEYRAVTDTLSRAQDDVSSLNINFLEGRRYEKDFLLRKDLGSVDKFAAQADEARAVIADLASFADSSTRAKLDTITKGYDAYIAAFDGLVEKNKALGLTPDEGLEGAMRKAVHKIEEQLKSVSNDAVRAKLLNLRRHEKDFIIRRDVKLVAEHAKEVEAFAGLPADRFGSAEIHRNVMGALGTYASAFKAYADLTLTEGETRKAASNAYASVEPVIEGIVAEFNKLKATNEAENARVAARNITIALAALVATVLILAACVYLIGRSISRPIITVTGAMRDLANGDTTITVTGLGRRDEIGEMANALEVFRQAAIANKRLEEEAAANRAKVEAERIRLQQEAEAAAQERLNEATSGLAIGLRKLAAGDLAFELNEPFAPDFEQLRHDLNAAVRQLGGALTAVAQSTHSIDSGSREISQSADDLSKRTEQQAASLEETAAALDQITVNVGNSSKRADEARAVAIQANTSAVKSGAVVDNAVEAMERIEQSSNQISNIIGVIDEIAFQTNLLALNAGVEAARAGEAGKGFAVVAQEVRELAQRSAQAAKEIKDLIRNSSAEVQGGVKLVRDTGLALRTIGDYVAQINQHMDAIATSAREQSVGLSEVNTAVNQMDQVTQQNAAMVEEANAAASTLATEAGRLRELVGRFDLGASVQSAALRQAAASMAATPVRSSVQTQWQSQASPKRVANGGFVETDNWQEF